MEIKLPWYVKNILDKLNFYNHAAYIVGGCVRDAIMGVEPHDWDITTDATPDEVESIFADTIPTGKKYGTITVAERSEDGMEEYYCEVTTFRADGNYGDGRRPDAVKFGKSITDDLERRDFTINAMAYNELVGLVDPFDGMADISMKIIRCVGSPEKRFNEDALRILRAIRFSARLGFKIDSLTANMMYSLRDNVRKNVSKERVHDELVKILEYSQNLNANKYDGLVYVFNDIFELDDDLSLVGYVLNEHTTAIFKLYELLKGRPLYEVEIWLRKYKFSNNDIKEILTYCKIEGYLLNPHISEADIAKVVRHLFNKYDYEYVCRYLNIYTEVKGIDLAEVREQPCRINQLAVDGNLLKGKYGLEGKQIGDMLDYLMEKVLDDPSLNTYENLTTLIEEKLCKED